MGNRFGQGGVRAWGASVGRLVCLSIWCACSASGQTNSSVSNAPSAPPVSATPTNGASIVAGAAERARQACLQGRRQICGRVLQISSAGLVIESGYTELLRAPLNKSWLIPGTVSAGKNLKTLELDEPGAPCIGLVLLATFPKSPPVKLYDYVVIQGYTAGSFEYLPVPGVQKTIRKFTAGLDSAVQLRLAQPSTEPQRP